MGGTRLAQSVGGGGGNGGWSGSGSFAGGGSNAVSIGVSLGGTGGTGNAAGNVTVDVGDTVYTEGDGAIGVLAQSIGGGGGNGGFSFSGSITGAGTNAGGVNVSLGGVGGVGGDVDVTTRNTVYTLGDGSHGVMAQSVGGGGGNGGFSVTGGVTLAAGGSGGTVGVSLGGDGGSGNDAGNVLVNAIGQVATEGQGAHGVFAQSVGGGGGNGGFAVSGSLTYGSNNAIGADVSLGGSGVTGGNAGSVGLTSHELVVTTGGDSHGLFAQSVGGGGGGGILGDSLNQAFLGSMGGVGSAGVVSVTHTGSLLALGDNGIGFLAQSSGPDGQGNITANLDGDIRGGDLFGRGVLIAGGVDNEINFSAASTASSVSGEAIVSGEGNDTFNNAGIVIGDMDLGGGDNAFNNLLDSTYLAFSIMDLGGGVLTNEGDFLMGLDAPLVPIDLLNGDEFGNLDDEGDPALNLLYGARVINEVTLNGGYIQTADGHFQFDVAFGPYDYDIVNGNGGIDLAGTGDVTLIWLENAEDLPLFTTTDTGNVAVGDIQITDTLAIDYEMVAKDNSADLTITTDFGIDGLNRNGRELGAHMDSQLLIGGAFGTGRLLALLGNLQDEETYFALFDELNGEAHVTPLQGLLAQSQNFSADLTGCDARRSVDDGECNWAELSVSSGDREGNFENFSLEENGVSLRGGGQRELNETYDFAFALGFESMDQQIAGGRRGVTSGEGITLGAALSRPLGENGTLTGALSGGWSQFETQRPVTIFEAGIAETRANAGFADFRVRASTEMGGGNITLRPYLEGAATTLIHDGFREFGKEGIGLASAGDTQTIFSASPGVAVQFDFGDADAGRAGRLSIDFGGRFYSEDHVALPLTFVYAPEGSRPADIHSYLDDQVFTTGMTFEIMGSDNLQLRFDYSGEFGDLQDRHQGGFSLGYRF